ncbi:hypothetical protein OAO01_03640 [Oligoflexia bacterium]|nr:hypothetical protein [Oligoflexia bacterium]
MIDHLARALFKTFSIVFNYNNNYLKLPNFSNQDVRESVLAALETTSIQFAVAPLFARRSTEHNCL